MFDVSLPEVRNAVACALQEDIGTGDITSELTVAPELQAHGVFLAKQDLIVAGVELLPLVYDLQGGAVLSIQTPSGTACKSGDTLASVSASARTLLRCERVALNFIQRLSGIATLASRYVSAVAGTGVTILDTRKTTPGLRQLEKMAARAGGVTNHRKGLFDAVLIKNNHITAAGGVRQALDKSGSYDGPVEIEVRTEAELEDALAWGAKHLLLDNLTPAQASEWIAKVAGRATVELSGNINLQTVRGYAEARPDYISSGAITHSATAVDISFRLTLDK
jgi:nicotinate-nucleotide pyrophosphorylase (carboxylating)